MKSRLSLAACAAVMLFASCHWFSKDESTTPGPLSGRWRIDSIQPGKDSAAQMALAFWAMSKDDSTTMEFRKDTVFTHFASTVDTAFYSYDSTQKMLIPKDSTEASFAVHFTSDSTLRLLSKDSLQYFLSRQ